MLEDLQIAPEELKKLRELGIIDEVALRNVVMKKEFRQKCKINLEEKGKPEARKEIERLSALFNLGEKAVSRIVYCRKPRKKSFITFIEEIK